MLSCQESNKHNCIPPSAPQTGFFNLIETPQSPQQCIIGNIIPPSITFLSISPTENDKKELGAVKMLILWNKICTLLLARHQQHYHC
jgi:hypothetical protein